MRLATTNHPLRLASHVRACQSDGQVILLDLKHNRYLGVGKSTAKALAAHIGGWPAFADGADSPSATATTSKSISDLTKRLVSQGLLTDAPLSALNDQCPDRTVEEATASLDLDDAALDRAISARQLAHFLASAAIAAWWIRWRSLHLIAMKVAARRDRILSPASDSLETMKTCTAVYETLRPFVFTAQERCLQDSLALVGFLTTQGSIARWVVGVKTSPFGAHSWVQSGHTVLNDQHEYVRRFRPILVV